MRIDEFDEFQGLTPQMIREWLREQGFDMRIGGLLHAGRYLAEWEPIESAWRSTEASLYAVAQYRNQSVQSLLREINPRMRGPGYPSDAAARAHGNGGWWVFQHQQGADDPRSVTKPGELHTAQMCLSSAFNDVRFYWERGLMGEPCDEACMWWPCDEHGNKVRWPTDAQGNML